MKEKPAKAASKKARASRVKGKRGEKEWADWLDQQIAKVSDLPHFEVIRRNQYRWSGRHRPEVAVCIRGQVVDYLVHCECKWQEALNFRAAMRQAVADARPGSLPVVASKRSREPMLITMQADDWSILLVAWLKEILGEMS